MNKAEETPQISVSVAEKIKYVTCSSPFFFYRIALWLNSLDIYIFRALSVSSATTATATGLMREKRGRRRREEEEGVPASLKARWSEGVGRTGGWQDCADGRALVQSMPIRGSHKSWALWAGLCQQSTE